MSQKSSAPPTRVPAEKLVRDIRRATRKHHSAEDKIRIVLEGLRGDVQPPFYVPVICGFTKYVSGAGGRMPRAWCGRIWLYWLSH